MSEVGQKNLLSASEVPRSGTQRTVRAQSSLMVETLDDHLGPLPVCCSARHVVNMNFLFVMRGFSFLILHYTVRKRKFVKHTLLKKGVGFQWMWFLLLFPLHSIRQRQSFYTETQKLYGTIEQNDMITFSVPLQTHMQYIQVTDIQGHHIHSSVASSAD